ncbi:hypothetical protein [Pseudofrankia asymbiotica]|uniref:Uncharacterized protein n=1 Tax=Pseudofrankia asymbiotica TaxID=1834516 RepID=A0A1V2I3E4_9ACTN|nr:hypothetical protein [Pseudofrankia asymbiotica]ONH23425.1 hypothetical protein BL253_33035 [Pseudofrankia asymbiotica]
MAAGSLSALDTTLDQLRAGAAGLGAALLELDTDANRALLDPAARTGATAERSRAVRARLDWLWERHLLLSGVIRQAETLRGDRTWLGPRRLAELEALLHRASQPRPPAPPAAGGGDADAAAPGAGATSAGASAAPAKGGAPVPRPPAGPASGIAAYPEDLLDGTSEVVEAVRRDVNAVVAAWASSVGQLSAAERRLAELTVDAARLGLADLPELADARAAVRAHGSAVAADPLSAQAADLAAAAAAVDEADAVLGVLGRARGSLPADLRAAETLLAEVLSVAAEGERHARRTVERVAGARAALARLDEGWLADPRRGLRPWLDRLVDAAAGGDWPGAARGLLAWRGTAEATLRRAREVAEENAAPLRRRDELRGLLGALHAKAAADGSAEDPDLIALHRRAHDALYIAPSDLDLAGDLVHGYAAAVTAGRGGASGTGGVPARMPPAAPSARSRGRAGGTAHDDRVTGNAAWDTEEAG